MLDQLREQAGLGGTAAALANELLVIREQFEAGQLSRDEYEFLVQEVRDVKSQQQLATDEIACRWIVAAAQALLYL
jgi:hypothetical protein